MNRPPMIQMMTLTKRTMKAKSCRTQGNRYRRTLAIMLPVATNAQETKRGASTARTPQRIYSRQEMHMAVLPTTKIIKSQRGIIIRCISSRSRESIRLRWLNLIRFHKGRSSAPYHKMITEIRSSRSRIIDRRMIRNINRMYSGNLHKHQPGNPNKFQGAIRHKISMKWQLLCHLSDFEKQIC